MRARLPMRSTRYRACILDGMRRAYWVSASLLLFSCVDARETPHFDESGQGHQIGGSNPKPHSTSAGATGASTSGATGSGGAGGGGIVEHASCKCIYEIGHDATCGDCEQVGRSGSCSAAYDDCLSDAECTSLLQFCVPVVQDDQDAVDLCYAGSNSSVSLLDAYLTCICNDPGACTAECGGGQQECGTGGGGSTSSTGSSSTASSSSSGGG